MRLGTNILGGGTLILRELDIDLNIHDVQVIKKFIFLIIIKIIITYLFIFSHNKLLKSHETELEYYMYVETSSSSSPLGLVNSEEVREYSI